MDFTPVNDFFSNIKDKLTNPFFGTLIIIWLSRNWELVYSIFNFETKITLACKIQIIKNYLELKNFFIDLCICTGYAIFFMIVGYIIIISTRTLSMFVDHNIMPQLTNKIVSKEIVLKSIYDETTKERDQYFNDYQIERKRVREFSKDYEAQIKLNDELTKKYKSLETDDLLSTSKALRLELENENLISDNKKLTNDNIILTDERNYLSENNIFIKDLFNEENFSIENFIQNSKILRELILNLENENYVHKFISAMNFYYKGGGISGEIITRLVELKLFKNRLKESESPTIYGELIFKFILNDKTLSSGYYINYKKINNINLN